MFKLFSIDTVETFKDILEDPSSFLETARDHIKKQIAKKLVKQIINSKLFKTFTSRTSASFKADLNMCYRDFCEHSIKIPSNIAETTVKCFVESYFAETNVNDLYKKVRGWGDSLEEHITSELLRLSKKQDQEKGKMYGEYVNTKINEVLNNLPEGTKE